jgi:uncharacterized protein YjbI with pentapeptide repeats
MKAEQNYEVWQRLASGGSLDGLSLGTRAGRTDVSGLVAPKPVPQKTLRTAFGDAALLSGIIHLKGVSWRSVDFSGSRLEGLRLSNCEILDCNFDSCRCKDWKIWGTTIADSSFRSADLRSSALGGLSDGQRNRFRAVDFTTADLRDASFYPSAEFVGCTFRSTQLTKVHFWASSFSDCSFEGDLEEVTFMRSDPTAGDLPPNEMLRVDFSKARLLDVEFRGLDLDRVTFPADPEHIIVEDYHDALGSLVRASSGKNDPTSRAMCAYYSCYLGFAGPQQRRGVLNRSALLEGLGHEGLRRTLEVLQSKGGAKGSV